MRTLKFIFLFLLIVSCSGPRAVYDYDQKANFNSYRTYSIYPELRTGLSQLDERRLISSLQNALLEEDLSEGTDPDILVNVYSEEFREPSRNSLGVGVGGSGRNVGVGVSGGIPIGGPETYLRLTFDFIDADTDALVWQSVVESPFDLNASPEQRQASFDRIVAKALKGYPPKK